jgi:ribosomal-protein-serine acetyltransferase
MGRLEIAEGSHLRLLVRSDAEELHRLIEANRPYLSRWLPWAAGQTIEHTVDFIGRSREQLTANDGFQAALIVDEELVGVVGYHGVDWNNRRTAIGYWLSEERQGRGTMTAAVRLLTEHALSVWELNRVEIRAAVENRRSRAIPERLGFRRGDDAPGRARRRPAARLCRLLDGGGRHGVE